MRHFAEELKADGWQVTYAIAEDFVTPLKDWIKQNQITELQVTKPCDRPSTKFIQSLELNCQLHQQNE